MRMRGLSNPLQAPRSQTRPSPVSTLDRELIEQEFLRSACPIPKDSGRSSASISIRLEIRDHSAIYRRAHALGLFRQPVPDSIATTPQSIHHTVPQAFTAKLPLTIFFCYFSTFPPFYFLALFSIATKKRTELVATYRKQRIGLFPNRNKTRGEQSRTMCSFFNQVLRRREFFRQLLRLDLVRLRQCIVRGAHQTCAGENEDCSNKHDENYNAQQSQASSHHQFLLSAIHPMLLRLRTTRNSAAQEMLLARERVPREEYFAFSREVRDVSE